jgi:predicted Zn-dependent peptidase
LERYFKTYYAPNNCVVVVSGAIKTEEVKRLAQKYLEPIPAQPAPPKVHIVEPVQTGERRIVQKRSSYSLSYDWLSYPETKHEDYYALNILSSILSSGKSSLTKNDACKYLQIMAIALILIFSMSMLAK